MKWPILLLLALVTLTVANLPPPKPIDLSDPKERASIVDQLTNPKPHNVFDNAKARLGLSQDYQLDQILGGLYWAKSWAPNSERYRYLVNVTVGYLAKAYQFKLEIGFNCGDYVNELTSVRKFSWP